MVGKELIRQTVTVAESSEQIGIEFDLDAPIRELQVGGPAKRLEQVLSNIDLVAGSQLLRLGSYLDFGVFASGVTDRSDETLLFISSNLQPNLATKGRRSDLLHRLAISWSKKLRRKGRVPQRGRKSDSWNGLTSCDVQSMHQRLQLSAALRSYECVNFVYDDES